MAENSKIQWTHHTFNPWRGCTKVSAGCQNCYADTQAKRNPKVLGIWGPNGTRVVASEQQWRDVLKWDRDAEAAGERCRVFCASMADVFEDWGGPMVDSKGEQIHISGREWSNVVNDGITRRWEPLTMDHVRARLFSLVHETPHLDWLLLTKRPQNFVKVLRGTIDTGHLRTTETKRGAKHWDFVDWLHGRSSPANIWLGATVENQEQADERIPHLLAAPTAVRFLSCEPLLGPVDLSRWLGPWFCGIHHGDAGPNSYCGSICRDYAQHGKSRMGFDWVIVGGESGHGARSFDLAWARSLVEQCKAVGVPVFVKQLGERPVSTGNQWGKRALPMLAQAGYWILNDKKGGDPAEWPEHLQVREFPKAAS